MPGEGRINNSLVCLNLDIMATLKPGVYVRIVQLESGPTPFPLSSGFNTGTAYRAIGRINPPETFDAYFTLSYDRDELWFICNRLGRVVGVPPRMTDTRMPTQDALRMVERGLE